MKPLTLPALTVALSAFAFTAWNPGAFPGLPNPKQDLLETVPLGKFETAGIKGQVLEVPDAKGRPVVRVEIPAKAKNLWDAQLRWIPKVGATAGTTLVWVFWARISPEDKDNETCDLTARLQKNSPDWATYFNQSPVLDRKWKRFAWAFSPKADLGASDVKVSYLLGARKAVLEFADISFVDLGSGQDAAEVQARLDKIPAPAFASQPPSEAPKASAPLRTIPGPAIAEIPVIHAGFEGDTKVLVDGPAYASLRGADPKCPEPNSWEALGEGLAFDFLAKGYDGRSAFEIVADPVRPGNRVLRTRIIDKGLDGINGRAQGTFYPKGRHDLQHYRFRQYISPDYKLLVDIPESLKPQWTDFLEIWSPVPEGDEEVKNGAGAFRVCYDFQPDRKGGFHWHLTGHNMSGKKTELYQGWNAYNDDVAVPFGKWCEWDVLIVKGPDPKVDPASRAQVLVKMRPEGQREWTTLFDIRNERTEHSRIKQKGWYQVAPFKNYLGPKTVEWLLSKGATDISLYFDEFSYSVGDPAGE